jgi:hypothetical protein
MALPSMVLDTYRRYKKGTEGFVQWLAGTARATGTVEEVFKSGPQEPRPTPGGRLKGKARKEAKKAGLATNTSTCQVPIKTFVKLAKAVVASPHVQVPRSVTTTLRAVIQGRKNCAAWYLLNQDDASDTMKRNNDGHQYFIKVLQDTLDILNRKAQQTGATTSQDSDPYLTKVANMFASLEVEETSEVEMEDIPEVSPKSKVEKRVEYKLETSEADVSFAVYCFLKDLTNIRLFVRRTWREFKHGEIGLQAAALTMTAAIGMIEKLSDEFQEAYPRFKETDTEHMHPKIINFVFGGYCSSKPASTFLDAKNDSTDPFAYKEGGQKLHSSTVMCNHTADLTIKYFLYGERQQLRLSADEKRLIKCLSQLAALPMDPTGEGRPLQGDMVHKAIKKLVCEAQLDTWIIFAIQIFWDTQRELGAMLPVAQQLVEQTGEEIRKRYTAYFDTEGLEDIGEVHKMFRNDIQGRLQQAEAVAMSKEFQSWADDCEDGAPWKFNMPKFSLLSCHPALCGLVSVNIRDEFHRTSINIASGQGQILITAHFYNAAHLSGLLPRDVHWDDLDLFIEKQGSDWIFVGERPKEWGSVARRLNLARGLGPSKFAKDYKNPNGPDGYHQWRGKIRCFEYLARYSELSWERLGNKFKKPSGESRARKDVNVMADMLARDFLGVEKTDAVLSTLTILNAFKKAVEKDESAFDFDVMNLYLRCLRLLRAIQAYCLRHARDDYPDPIYDEGLGMNAIINEMLNHCDGRKPYSILIFPDAVEMLRNVIEEEGSEVIDHAKACQEDRRIQQVEPMAENEPSFENPGEDMVGLQWRNMFSSIIVQDPNGDVRMPFGMGR